MYFRIRPYSLSLIFLLLSLWFWCILCQGTMAFYESVLLFTYDSANLLSYLDYPGGIADLIADFLTQFFALPYVGGVILSLGLLALQLLSNAVLKTVYPHLGEVSYILSFIPAFCAWAFMCTLGNQLTAVVALLLITLCLLLYFRSYSRYAWTVLLAYVLCGPLAVILPLSALLFHALRKENRTRSLLSDFAGLALLALLPYLWSLFAQYPLRELYLGVNYVNLPGSCPASLIVLSLSLPVSLLLAMPFNLRLQSQTLKVAVSLVLDLGIFIGAWFYISVNTNPVTERILGYDRMVQNQQWDEILLEADRRRPRSVAELSAINLALASKGELLDEMFRYPQEGVQGLFPDYTIGYIMSMSSAEALLRCGMVNAARNYAYEKFESYPNYKYSARQLKLVCEADLLNGNYNLARKNLQILSRTIFYSDWAKQAVEHPDALLQNDRYSDIKAVEASSVALYNTVNDSEKLNMLRELLQYGLANEMAKSYLLAADLLMNDLEFLISDLQLTGYDYLPKYLGQALLLAQFQGLNLPETLQAMIPEADRKRFDEFSSMLLNERDLTALNRLFGDTYWFYYTCRRQ